MKTQRTLTLVKPSAFGKADEIFKFIESKGFKVLIRKKFDLTYERAALFYREHYYKLSFDKIVTDMSSGTIVVAVLEKENAVRDFRTLLGAKDPAQAAEGTIRKLFGKSKAQNSVHGSDSLKSADTEIKFFFYLDGF